MGDVVESTASNITLNCRIDSVQPMSSVRVRWAKDGTYLATNQAVKISSQSFESEYTIIDAVGNDAGTYNCTTVSIVYTNQYIVSSNQMITNEVKVLSKWNTFI